MKWPLDMKRQRQASSADIDPLRCASVVARLSAHRRCFLQVISPPFYRKIDCCLNGSENGHSFSLRPLRLMALPPISDTPFPLDPTERDLPRRVAQESARNTQRDPTCHAGFQQTKRRPAFRPPSVKLRIGTTFLRSQP